MFRNHEQKSDIQRGHYAGGHIKVWKGLYWGLRGYVQSGLRQFSAVATLAVAIGVVQLFAEPAHAQVQTIYLDADRAIERAQSAMAKGEMEVALTYFKKAERRNISAEHRVIVQNSICAVAFQMEAYTEAEASCSLAIDSNHKYWKAFVNRGNVRRALGNSAGAISDYCEAIRLSPEHVKGNFTKAQCLG